MMQVPLFLVDDTKVLNWVGTRSTKTPRQVPKGDVETWYARGEDGVILEKKLQGLLQQAQEEGIVSHPWDGTQLGCTFDASQDEIIYEVLLQRLDDAGVRGNAIFMYSDRIDYRHVGSSREYLGVVLAADLLVEAVNYGNSAIRNLNALVKTAP